MRILRENSIGLVIDIQERLFPYIHEHDELANSAAVLVKGLNAVGVPLIVTQQYTKGLGPTIQSLAAIPSFPAPIEKIAFSCCDEPLFLARLAESGKKYVIITGIETHVCVLQTTIDLLQSGYLPVVVEDCVGSRRYTDKQTAINRMRAEGAVITSYESILFELLRYSGTATFKEISNLVK